MSDLKYDYLIVGAGFSGAVLAERLAARAGKRVLVVERRDHIGGNCYDYYDRHGVLVHKYGPHYFRTNSKRVIDYLSNFTEWHPVEYRIRALVEGKLVPFPINLDTVNELYGHRFSVAGMKRFLDRERVHLRKIRNSEDAVISQVGRDLFEKFYRGYTVKQWGREPRELAASVCARIPVRLNRDDRYFNDKYQAMPKHGYHVLFRNLLRHPNIHLMLQADFRSVRTIIPHDRVIYTGPLDEYFQEQHGKLPYRSLRFEHETLDMEYFQQYSQINYPNEHDFTRIVEIKHATGQRHPMTTIVREYPTSEGDPFYPIPAPENEWLAQKYEQSIRKLRNVHFIGRLAQYRYLNMDQVVLGALDLFERLHSGTGNRKRVQKRSGTSQS